MKRKRADYPDWQRIIQKRFAATWLEESTFRGYVTLFYMDAVRAPLWRELGGQKVCLADAGYTWLQHFPQGARHVLTSTFDAQGTLVRWYVDICKQHFRDEQGIIWYDDLYLDLDVSPEGAINLLDVDELDDALRQGQVSPTEYELAWKEANALISAIEEDMFPLISTYGLCEAHRETLLKLL
jgi:predicted RNA-binding protein associated with RNAse of E/G family